MHLMILGAGIAGLACADRLLAAGHRVTLFDKGRGPGGRMSTRRAELPGGTVQFDHGAQYFTVRSPAFAAEVARWAEAGLAAPWPAAGPEAWVGAPAMNAPIKHMAGRHAVRFGHHAMGLSRDAAGWWARFEHGAEGPFDAALVALPAEQAAAFLGAHDLPMAANALAARSRPCWTAMIAFERPLAFGPDCLRHRGPIGWAARNSAKPGRKGPEAWVVQAGPDWSIAHLEEPAEAVAQALLAALAEATGEALPPPSFLAAHRWRFAMTAPGGPGPLWKPALGLGACGDWLLGPRVELAWASGHRLAGMILGSDEAEEEREPAEAEREAQA